MNEGGNMDRLRDVETAVLHYLQQHWVCPMEELFRNLPTFTANQMFLTVDRLSREGKVLLRYQNRSQYVIVRPRVARESSCERPGVTIGYTFFRE
ncbi:MAG: hypothetical protein H8K10_20925 [Nitrospira sp.]|nr:hypothetical protein [Nitrospira sp.]